MNFSLLKDFIFDKQLYNFFDNSEDLKWNGFVTILNIAVIS